MKDKKTTYIAIASGIGVLVSTILVLFGKATLMEAAAYLGAFGAFMVTILGLFTKDSKNKIKATTTSLEEDEIVESIDRVDITLTNGQRRGVIPGRGIKEPPPSEG